jgi:hypothetical protein
MKLGMVSVAAVSVMLSLAAEGALAAQGGIKTSVSYGRSQMQACVNAKKQAADQVPRDGSVVEYSECVCEQQPGTDVWSCSVDAKWVREER